MSERRALVTGAARRLGRAMALYLAERGYDIALHCHEAASEADAVAAQIAAMGRQVAILPADLTCEAESQALVPAARHALGGRLTLLVNNASIFEADRIATASRESWDRHLESNLRAPVVLTAAFAEQAPDPERDGRGEWRAAALVVNIVDQRVRKLTPRYMSYTIAKSALWTFTRTAAQELAPGIRVNAIGPGPTLAAAAQSEAEFLQQRAACPLGRGSDPEDICAALGYLVEAKAVTGQLICVDGGQHLAWQTPDQQMPG